MKYIISIIVLIVIVSIGTLFALKKPPPVGTPVLSINDRAFTQAEFDNRYKMQPYQKGDKSEFVQTLIMRELLIQAAKNQGIDKEEAFRWSIQNFYEQSLIKVLMDRQYKALEMAATEEQVNRCLGLIDKKLTITEFISEKPSASGIPNEPSRQFTDRFENLSAELQFAVYSLVVGEISAPIAMGGVYYVYRLDALEEAKAAGPTMDREQVRQLLSEHLTAKAVEKWIDSLKKQADIKVAID